MTDVLGSVAFSPVKKDMLGNVKVCTANRARPVRLGSPAVYALAHTNGQAYPSFLFRTLTSCCFVRKSVSASSPHQPNPTRCKTSASTSSRRRSTRQPKACSGLPGERTPMRGRADAPVAL